MISGWRLVAGERHPIRKRFNFLKPVTIHQSPVTIFIFFFFLLSISSCATGEKSNKVCFKNTCFTVEIAQKQEELLTGFKDRTVLPKSEGMLFVFPVSGHYTFWMKDTLIPLDIIWLDPSRRVIDIKPDAEPCRKEPCPSFHHQGTALYVLEINAGLARSLRIKNGDTVDFHLK